MERRLSHRLPASQPRKTPIGRRSAMASGRCTRDEEMPPEGDTGDANDVVHLYMPPNGRDQPDAR